MENKLNYESPEAEIIQVRMKQDLLQASDPVTVNDYDPWEEEDI